MENETHLAELVGTGDGDAPSCKACSVEDRDKLKQDLKDANTCMLLGAGVGAVGVISALSIGAVCPLCVVAAPGLIGFGFLRRLYLKFRKNRKTIISETLK